jgi:hypothetical protein
MTEQPADIQEVTVEPPAEEPAAPEAEEPAAPEAEEPSVPHTPPPTPKPKRAPRKAKAIAPLIEPAQVAPTIDASFWSTMLQTKREMDRQATATRYANLVKF